MKNTFYLLRHAQRQEQVGLHFSEFPLADLGHQQASQIVEALESLNLDYIYCSPFIRTKQTIAPFLESNSVPIEYREEIKGRNVGSLPKGFLKDLFTRTDEIGDYSKYNAENKQECIDRIVGFIQSVDSIHKEKNILIVSHSNPIALYLQTLDPNIDLAWFEKMKSPCLFKTRDGYEEIELDIK